jgi:hypothetical protein
MLNFLQEQFPLTNLSEGIKINYLHPKKKTYFLFSETTELDPLIFLKKNRRNSQYQGSCEIMLNIPRWNDVNKQNKKWHSKSRKFDLGQVVKKVEEMENVIEKLREVLYGVVKLNITNLKQEMNTTNVPKRHRKSTDDRPPRKESISYTGEMPKRRKDTGIDLDLSKDLSSESSDLEEMQNNLEKMEIGKSIIETMKGIYTQEELDQLWYGYARP